MMSHEEFGEDGEDRIEVELCGTSQIVLMGRSEVGLG